MKIMAVFRRACVITFACITIVRAEVDADWAHITILSTTDLHGHIYPVNYHTGKPEQTGIAKAATLIKQARAKAPQLILIDSGDTIQGTPLAYYHNRVNNAPPDPMMLVMNALKYDAMAMGNHEYNFGLRILEKARHEARFPWLSANTMRAGTTTPAYEPYIVKEVDGVRIGILGLTTPGVPGWEDAANYAGLEFHDPVAVAQKYVRQLREKERADIVVIAMHMGLEKDLHTGRLTPDQQPQENAAMAIAENVPGIDIIFMGHTHREIPALIINGVLMSQANKWGDRVMRADVYLEKAQANPGEESKWRIVAREARTLTINGGVPADPEILKLAEPYHQETEAWLNKTIGNVSRELTAAGSRLRDSTLIDLVQHTQLEAAEADISFAASFNTSARLREGPVTVRDLYGLYPYENTLVAIELTGAQVRAALEHSARYYILSEPAANGTRKVRENPQMPGYNYDMAEGVSYEIDPARPVGDRVLNLRWKGEPIDLAQKFRVAINNYRHNGGGGYTMFKDAPVLWRSSTEVRDLLISWVVKHGEIPVQPTDNWRVVENK